MRSIWEWLIIRVQGTLLACILAFFVGLGRRIFVNWHEIEQLQQAGTPFIICCWHNNILYGVLLSKLRLWSTTSLSRDGDLTQVTFSFFGVRFVRGSSSKGGIGLLRGAIAVLKRKECVFITLDGPRGPRYDVKPGAIMMACKAQVPIVPLCFSSHRRWQFDKSWDAMRLPKPFARTVIMVGKPIWPQEFPLQSNTKYDTNVDISAASDQLRHTMLILYRRAESFSGAAQCYTDLPLWTEKAD